MSLYIDFRVLDKLITISFIKDKREYEFTSSREDELGSWCTTDSVRSVGRENLRYYSLSPKQIEYIENYLFKWDHSNSIDAEIVVPA